MTSLAATVPTTGDRVRLSAPVVDDEIEAAVVGVLRSGRLTNGPVVEEMESLCASMAGVRHAVAVTNGTTSLELALDALGVGPGDEVVTTGFTFIATIGAIVSRGATARVVDIGDDHCIDTDALRAAIGPNTVAAMPVHLYGLPADMVEIDRIATAAGIAIVEDAAQAHGASVSGRPVGSYGQGSFSFYATKNVHAAEGGVVTTDDPALADHVRLARNQGMVARYDYRLVGGNHRLSDLHAAIAVPQLRRLDAINAARQANADRLSLELADHPLLDVPLRPAGRASVWHQFTITLRDPLHRLGFMETLDRHGVDTAVYYPSAVNDLDVLHDHALVVADPTPRSRDLAARCVSLPVHDRLRPEDIDRILEAIAAATIALGR